MALSHEDKKDVSKHMGKALAKKISHVTDDSKMSKKDVAGSPRHKTREATIMARHSETSDKARDSIKSKALKERSESMGQEHPSVRARKTEGAGYRP